MEKNHKKRKKAIVMVALLSIAILMTGTYAWQSISQEFPNEVVTESYPGGRVHDDFDGSNKDVYAENYADEGGVPVYVRIRLDEYMEIGDDAGDFTYDDNGELKKREAEPLIKTAKVDDKSTWRTRTPDQSKNPFAKYWNWIFGGSTIYMPTFDKNKDSLSVDVNGTYQGDGTGVPYNDYYPWALGEPSTSDAYYDADDNNVDEGANSQEHINYEKQEETHVAAKTKTATVLSIDEWKKLGSPVGNYWVWDDDGWFYWARPLRAQQTTGLLLNEIVQIDYPDSKCYYSINVVGQFATAGDFGDKNEETGFYKDGNTISEKAEALLKIVTSVVEGKDGKEYVDCGNNTYKMLNEDGTYGSLVCAGENMLIGDDDDLTNNIIVLDQDLIFNGTNYGHLFLCPTSGSMKYQGMNTTGDQKLGTGDDVCIYYTGSINDFPDEGKGTLSEVGADAIILNATAATSSSNHTAKIDTTTKTITVQPNDVVSFTTSVTLGGTTIGNQKVKWNISKVGDSAISFDENTKKLTVGATPQVGTSFTLQAISDEDTRVTSDIYTVIVEGPQSVAISKEGQVVTATTDVAKSKTAQTTTVQFRATVKAADGTTYANQDVKWDMTGQQSGTTLSQTGLLTVAIAEDPENTLSITATSKFDTSVSQTITVNLKSIFDGITVGSTSTVTIDGTKFYVLAKDTSKAKTQYLLFATDPTTQSAHGSTRQWTTSCTQYTTLKEWLEDQSTLKVKVQETTLYTRSDCTTYGTFISDTYDVFSLSEADLFGTQNGKTVTDNREYTYPTIGRLTSNTAISGFTDTTYTPSYSSGRWYWLRSPRVVSTGSDGVAGVRTDAAIDATGPYATRVLGLRPALWVNGL